MAEQLTHLDDRFWNRLLKAIEEGQVVPIVGSQLLTWDGQNISQSLQQLVAKRVLEFNKFDATSVTLTPHRELHEAVSMLKPTVNLQDLYGDIADALDAVTKEQNFKLPGSIEKLAAISSFKLLVTLTPDTLLAQALRKRVAVNEIVHSPNLPTSEASDLAIDWLKKPGEVNLLYLFGKAKSTPVFAIHDEDTLEYAHNLLSRGSNVPLRFVGELQQRGLLFIGSNFPDWLSRFLLRLTNQTRLADKKTRAWLVEDGNIREELALFLNGFSRETEIISELSPQAFIDELYSRWLVRNSPTAASDSAKQNQAPDPLSVAFFISYSRATDLPAAEQLYQTMREQGLAENEIWFDRTAIEPGGDFQKLIFEGIHSCRYFLPLISAEADNFIEKFFRREWNAAIDRSKAMAQGEEFIVPIILDEEYNPQGYARVPKDWSDSIDFGHAPGGVADARTRQHLTKLIRELRRGEK